MVPNYAFQSQSLFGSVNVGSAGMVLSAAYKIFPWTDVSAVAGVAPPLPLSTWLVTPPPPFPLPTSHSDGPAGWLLPPSPLLWSMGQHAG